MNSNQTIRWAIACAVTIACVGCGGDTGPKRYKVTGTITQKGTPIEGAAVAFSPTSGEGLPASAITDASGVYHLTTKVNGDGAVPGSYKVTVAKYESPPDDAAATPAPEPADPYDITNEYPENYDEAQADEDASRSTTKNLLPAKYASPSTSGFSADVAESDDNSFDFELE